MLFRSDDKFVFNYDKPNSIGKIKNFFGNFNVMVKAYSYILTMGADGLKEASEMAVLNANYIKEKLKKYYYLPVDNVCKHEFVLSSLIDGEAINEVSTLDIAKRLIDYGYHPPTTYFPLIVDEALMIEPTETESIETLDGFIDAMIKILEEAKENPEVLKAAPHDTPVRRIDEVKAALKPVLRWEKE